MQPPGKFAMGFGGDGIVFEDIQAVIKDTQPVVQIFRQYKSFLPKSNSALTFQIPWDNQYVLEEYTMGNVS